MKIPALEGREIHRFTACIHATGEVAVEAFSRVGPFRTEYADYDTGTFGDVMIEQHSHSETGEPCIHIHIELGTNPDEFPQSDGALIKEDIEKRLSELDEVEFSGFFLGQVVMPADSVPKSSVVSAIGGVSTEVDGNRVVLTGGQLTFTDSDDFDELGWKIRSENAEVYLKRTSDGALGCSVLNNELDEIEEGFKRFCLLPPESQRDTDE